MKLPACFAALALFPLATLPSQGQIVFDSFDYANGPVTGSGGSGFTGAWATSNGSLSVIDKAWGGWTGYTSALSGKAITSTSGGTNNLITRQVTSAIDTTENGVYYYSYLLNGDPSAAGWTNIVFNETSGTTGNTGPASSTNFVSQYRGNDFRMSVRLPGVQDESAALTRGADYLIIGKMEFNSVGLDTVSLSAFAVGADVSSEPLTWQASADASIEQDINFLSIRINDATQFSNITMGSTYESVINAIPEPTSASLIALVTVSLLLRRQSKS